MRSLILITACLLSSYAATTLAEEFPNQHHLPFRTVQPSGAIITLTYQGDEHFNWYEDPNGYTVVDSRGAFRYATLDADGLLAPTEHLVGEVNPMEIGLVPAILPSTKAISRQREKSRERQAARGVPLNDRIPQGATLIEGCILLPQSAASENAEDPGGNVQRGVSTTTRHWTNGEVYYTFDTAVGSTERSAMLEAMRSWEAVADIRFIQRTNQSNYIYIFSGTGNWSYVGMIGGRQDLSIYNWDYKYIMMHELAHALGVWHEQSRADRDSYIQVNLGNVQSGMESNFDIQNGAQLHGDYNFDSIMHYGQCAFANCTCSSSCRTISCLPAYSEWQAQIGQKTHLSVGDAENMAFLYGSAATVSGMAQMTNPSTDGSLITGGNITFEWTTGSLVQEYRLTVGSSAGGTNYHNITGQMTNASVSGLPIEGGNVYVRLYSKIDGTWYFNSYIYITDLCPLGPDANDADGDGVPDACDKCPGFNDAIDSDGDSIPDACDQCPGEDDLADLDNDGIPDACDICPQGANNLDADNDGIPDACDPCPTINNSLDSDNDGVTNCLDECPNDPDKTQEGICGCGVADIDSDDDGTPDCNDGCPFDSTKLSPGEDGCNATEPITGGGLLGQGPGGVAGGGFCGAGASAAAMLSVGLLLIPTRSTRRRRGR
ncbi:MAG: thrombospondin type 3 repeat-containing protein [Phycisphaerae bacterium]|nr:thrombospondin type 3 repeat-containing protein [Phycisphaerae bacterium]